MKVVGGLARFGFATLAVVLVIGLARAYLAPNQQPVRLRTNTLSSQTDPTNYRTIETQTIVQPDVDNEWDVDRDSPFVSTNEAVEYGGEGAALRDATDSNVDTDDLPPPRDPFPQ